MENKFAVNLVLEMDITKINHTLKPMNPFKRGDKYQIREMERNIGQIIDQMGARSSQAQGLTRQITSADKLRNCEDQIVYLLKDAKGFGGQGEVIGLLKVGRKSLYVNDSKGVMHCITPLCLLDFYIVENRQRQGLGKHLFSYMLHDQHVSPTKLAIDSPSPLLISFMKTNYGITNMVKQVNNYALSSNYFDDVVDKVDRAKIAINQSNGSHNNGLEQTPSQAGSKFGRFAAIAPTCSIATVIHGAVDTALSPSENPKHGTETGYWGNEELERWAEPSVAHEEYQIEENTPREPIMEPIAKPEVEVPSTRMPDLQALQLTDATEVNGGPISPAGSATARRDSQVTDQGYFDLKFYHNKLW